MGSVIPNPTLIDIIIYAAPPVDISDSIFYV